MEYFAPVFKIEIGEYILEEKAFFEVSLDTEKSYNYAIIKITPKVLEQLEIKIYDEVKIYLGYDNELEQIFSGIITNINDEEINVKDKIYSLNKMIINKTFTKCDFNEALAFILNQANITERKIKNSITEVKNSFTINGLNGIDAIKKAEIKWGVKESIAYFDNDIFIYNYNHEQQSEITLKQGESITDLKKYSPFFEVKTVMIPFLKLRDTIEIIHEQLYGVFEIAKIKINTDEKGFIKMILTVKEG